MLNEVIGLDSSWSKSSVGRLQITMKKKEDPKYWKTLFKDPSEAPNNVKFWFEMHQKYSEELQQYIDLHEEEMEREEEEKNKEKRRKKIAERKANQKAKAEVKTPVDDL